MFWKSFFVRARMASLMMLAFGTIVWAGHMYVWILVMVLQALSFREVVNVGYVEYKSQSTVEVPLFRTLQWCWYGVAMVFVYGDFIKIFSQTHESAAWLVPYTRYHSILTFVLYCSIFMVSIGTLRSTSVRYQVGQLSWTIVTLMLVVGQMKFVANNIFNGLYWFVFPVWLVVNNDCWAYFWGALLGKKLIKRKFFQLSPKKTWEGFIGAAVSTILVAYATAHWFTSLEHFICPATKLTFLPHPRMKCEKREVFRRKDIKIRDDFVLVDAVPAQLHAVAFALFASLVAPYGGFLASAIKRAYHVKDFNSLIPGHGGVTDRVDCQFIMALFVYVYHKTFIRKFDVEWTKVYSMSQLLAPDHKLALYHALGKNIEDADLLT